MQNKRIAAYELQSTVPPLIVNEVSLLPLWLSIAYGYPFLATVVELLFSIVPLSTTNFPLLVIVLETYSPPLPVSVYEILPVLALLLSLITNSPLFVSKE